MKWIRRAKEYEPIPYGVSYHVSQWRLMIFVRWSRGYHSTLHRLVLHCRKPYVRLLRFYCTHAKDECR